MLTAEEIKKFETELIKTKARLDKEIKDLETPTDFGDDTGDPDDEEADEDEELENRGASADDLRKHRANVEATLVKITLNKYGVCEICGNKIEMEVLKIAPESLYCKKDKAGR